MVVCPKYQVEITGEFWAIETWFPHTVPAMKQSTDGQTDRQRGTSEAKRSADRKWWSACSSDKRDRQGRKIDIVVITGSGHQGYKCVCVCVCVLWVFIWKGNCSKTILNKLHVVKPRPQLQVKQSAGDFTSEVRNVRSCDFTGKICST